MKNQSMDILKIVEALISFYINGNLTNVSWLPHWYGCQLHDWQYLAFDEYNAAIELMAEELNVTVEKSANIAKKFAHGDYGM